MSDQMTITVRRPWPQALADTCRLLAWLTLGVSSFLWIALTVFGAFQAGRMYDFAQEWTSARNYLTGLPVYLDFGQSLELHIGGTANPTFSYNAHPPAAVLLGLPFGMLDYSFAYLSWNILSLICLVLSLWMIAECRRDESWGMDLLGLLVLVFFGNALAHQLVQGQLNLIILLLIAAAWAADRKDAVVASGALIGLAAALKLFPAFLVLYHLARRQWRAVVSAALAFLAVNAATWFLFTGRAYADYFLRAAPELSKFRDALPNASLLGFWAKLFDGSLGEVAPIWHYPPLAEVLAAVSILAVTATTLWALKYVRLSSLTQPPADVRLSSLTQPNGQAGKPDVQDTDRDLSFALCCAGMLLASPITWDHYFLLLIPSFWFAWQAYQGRPGGKTLIALFAVLLLWTSPYSLWDRFLLQSGGPNGRAHPVSPTGVLTLVSFQFYALLGFYLLIFAELRRRIHARNVGHVGGRLD